MRERQAEAEEGGGPRPEAEELFCFPWQIKQLMCRSQQEDCNLFCESLLIIIEDGSFAQEEEEESPFTY